jgi:hypothetical protein
MNATVCCAGEMAGADFDAEMRLHGLGWADCLDGGAAWAELGLVGVKRARDG